jgi:hypothetical protein
MALYLVETICKLAADAAAKQKDPKQWWPYLHAFRQGASRRLCARLDEMRAQAIAGKIKSDDPNSLLPAPANVYELAQGRNQEWLKQHYPKLRTSRTKTTVHNSEAFAAGAAAANSIGLHKQVGRRSAASKQLLH